MKHWMVLFMATALIMTACEYEEPLTQEHNIPVDPSVLGLWEEVPEKGVSPGPDQRMMVMKFSETEYLIHHPMGKDGLYFRGYPINVGGISCVQVQLIGNADGDIKDKERGYHVVSYRHTKEALLITVLNTDLVDTDLKSSADLRQAFLKNKDNPALFNSPGTFRRVKKQRS